VGPRVLLTKKRERHATKEVQPGQKAFKPKKGHKGGEEGRRTRKGRTEEKKKKKCKMSEGGLPKKASKLVGLLGMKQ